MKLDLEFLGIPTQKVLRCKKFLEIPRNSLQFLVFLGVYRLNIMSAIIIQCQGSKVYTNLMINYQLEKAWKFYLKVKWTKISTCFILVQL